MLSRAGFLSKGLWQEFFYRGKSKGGMHHGWAKLLKEPYFALHPNPYLKNIAVLNRSSRELHAITGGRFASAPPEGVFCHDEVCLRGVLQIESHGFLKEWQLEAGLKSSLAKSYRIESAGALVKYPDALLEFVGLTAPLRVAIEIELTQKDRKRYDQIINCYSFMKGIALVLFVTAEPAIALALKRSAKESFYPTHGLQMGFMAVADWKKNPLLAELEVKGQGQTLGSWVEAELARRSEKF